MEQMIQLDASKVALIVEEIQSKDEESRRAEFKKRQDIYNDGGKAFLIEQLRREFGEESIKELRLAPLNLLKKVVNKRASLYKRPPQRQIVTNLESDQALVDLYVTELDLNEKMDKWNRYWTLHSNAVAYAFPCGDKIKLDIVPPFLYSAVPNKYDRTLADVFVFNSFIEDGMIKNNQTDIPSATGNQGYSRNKGFKTHNDLVDSQQENNDTSRSYIFWTDENHFTTNSAGELLYLGEQVDTDLVNPIGMSPVINLAKDRDNEFWATQFQDTIDLSMAIMLGWTDLLTIAKHQGFSILTVVSEEEPKQLTIGVNKAVWLKAKEGGVTPSISYVTGASPLSEYKELLMELLGLLLTTANLNPKEIGGTNAARNFSSGFQALIESADILEARKVDMGPMKRAEQDLWEVIKRWHNYMFDTGLLNDYYRSFGRFSEDFAVNVQFADVKPLESEQERIAIVKDLLNMGLLTKHGAVKKLYPDMSDEEVDNYLMEIDNELKDLRQKAMESIQQNMNQQPEEQDSKDQEEDIQEEDQQQVGQ